MKLRSLILTGVLSATLFGGLTTISNADEKEVIKGLTTKCYEVINESKPKNIEKVMSYKRDEYRRFLGALRGSSNCLADKTHVDYKANQAVEDAYNYGTFAQEKQSKLKKIFTKKEYKQVSTYLRDTARNSVNVLNGKKAKKIKQLPTKLNNKVVKYLAYKKVADEDAFVSGFGPENTVYWNTENKELVDANLTGAEAGLLLSMAEAEANAYAEETAKKAVRKAKKLGQYYTGQDPEVFAERSDFHKEQAKEDLKKLDKKYMK